MVKRGWGHWGGMRASGPELGKLLSVEYCRAHPEMAGRAGRAGLRHLGVWVLVYSDGLRRMQAGSILLQDKRRLCVCVYGCVCVCGWVSVYIHVWYTHVSV